MSNGETGYRPNPEYSSEMSLNLIETIENESIERQVEFYIFAFKKITESQSSIGTIYPIHNKIVDNLAKESNSFILQKIMETADGRTVVANYIAALYRSRDYRRCSERAEDIIEIFGFNENLTEWAIIADAAAISIARQYIKNGSGMFINPEFEKRVDTLSESQRKLVLKKIFNGYSRENPEGSPEFFLKIAKKFGLIDTDETNAAITNEFNRMLDQKNLWKINGELTQMLLVDKQTTENLIFKPEFQAKAIDLMKDQTNAPNGDDRKNFASLFKLEHLL